jgi:hypothetical protein
MRKRIITGLLAGGLALAGAIGLSGGAQAASGDLDPAVAAALDSAGVAFARHNREHRMWEIQRNMNRQHYGRRGYAPAYGYRRGYAPGYGYGRGYARPGYGYGGGYQGTPGWAGRPGY